MSENNSDRVKHNLLEELLSYASPSDDYLEVQTDLLVQILAQMKGEELKYPVIGELGESIGVNLSNVGLSGIASSSKSFQVIESDEQHNIDVGHSFEKVVSFTPDNAFLLFAVGNTDVGDYSRYRYRIDGSDTTGELKTPIGLFNNPYRLPIPIVSTGKCEIEVRLTSDASSSSSGVVGKFVGYQIGKTLGDEVSKL